MNKKKLAVLVWGMFREFEHAHKTWSFLSDFDYDIFFSTWDKTYEENTQLKININEIVEKERILKYFPNAFVNIESENDVGLITNTKKMSYHWRKLFVLSINTNFEYEYVLLIRPDLYIKENGLSNLLKNFKENHILGLSDITHSGSPMYHFVQDCLFFGKYNIMRDVFLSFNPTDCNHPFIHYHLAKHFVYNDVYVQSIPKSILDFFVMRSVHREIKNLDFETLRKLGLEWWDSKHHNKETPLINALKNR